MNSTTITHRKRNMTISFGEVTKYNQKTIGGKIEWTQNNYDKSVSFFLKEVGNDKNLMIELENNSELSKTMKTELPNIIMEILILNGGMDNEEG